MQGKAERQSTSISAPPTAQHLQPTPTHLVLAGAASELEENLSSLVNACGPNRMTCHRQTRVCDTRVATRSPRTAPRQD